MHMHMKRWTNSIQFINSLLAKKYYNLWPLMSEDGPIKLLILLDTLVHFFDEIHVFVIAVSLS